MVDIEIIDIYDKGRSFVVEYEEKDTKKRNRHGFPKKRGWSEKDGKGEPYFLKRIKEKIKEERESDPKETSDLESYKRTTWTIEEDK